MTESRVVITADARRALAEFQRFRAQAVGAFEQVSQAGGVIGNVLGAIGGALSVAAFTGWIKGAIDATDAASDLSQKTGVAIEDLAGLELAFQKGGMESGAFESTMAKLSKQITDTDSALVRLGISNKNANGEFKTNKEVLYELADRFAGMEDGVQKAALAQELFGKSGTAMIPMLNEGSAGLREMDEMARKLGLTLSEEAVENAGKFNDTLDLLMLGGQGVARGIAAELLPTLSSLSGQFLTTMTSGDKLKNTAAFLATGLKLLYTVGVGIVEVFSTVGKTIGATGAQIVAVLQGDFSAAAQIGRQWQQDIGNNWTATLKSIEATWASTSDGSIESMAAFSRHATIVGKSAAEVADETKKAAKALEDEAKLLAELSGLTSTFASDWEALSKQYAKGHISLDQLTKAQAALLAKQPGIKAAAEQEIAARKEQADFSQRYAESLATINSLYSSTIKAAEEEADRNRELAATYGMTKTEIERLEIARLEEQLAQRATLGLTLDEIEHLEKLIDTKKRNAAALGSMEQADAAKAVRDEWKRTADSIQQSLTDALLRGFESGKGFGKNLVDTIKNMFKSLVLQPVISAVVNPVAGALGGALGLAGTAQAAASGGSSAVGNATGVLGGIGALSGSFGAGLSSGLSAWAAEGSVMGLLNSGALFGGGIVNGLGAIVGALGPIALGIGAAVAIWKKIDTSGTYHTGAASTATGSVVSSTTARSLNMEAIRNSAETQKFTDALALGIVGILDSTAAAFGKQAGYTAATAFADDTSKDGAWGSLRITNAAGKVLDWQDTKKGAWAPKTFADGKAGQDQYLAAMSQSVRQALDSIGLPSWAKQMLDGIGSGASVEEMAKVVDSITVTQSALKIMGERLVGFASLSESAVSSLMKAAGGIESLAAGASAYYDNFYTETEKTATVQKQLAETLKAVGLAVPKSRDEFRALVEQQLRLGEAGAPAVAALFKVAGAFAQLNPVLEETAAVVDDASAVLEERNRLQEEYDSLVLTETELLAKQQAAARESIDESNRLLFDQVQAARRAKEAQDAAKTSLGNFIGQMKSFATMASGLNDELRLGSLSTLTPEQQYAEARRQFDQTKQLARAGDAAAQGRLQATEQAFLQLSQRLHGSDAQYSADLAAVMSVNDELAQWAGAQVDVAQASLDALTDSSETLTDISATLNAIARADRLTPVTFDGSQAANFSQAFSPIDYSRMGTLDMAPLAAEVKALREELKGVRSDLERQTGDKIKAGAEAAQRAAETVVDGVRDAVVDGAYVDVNSRRGIK